MKIIKEKTAAFTSRKTKEILGASVDPNLPNVIDTETYFSILSLCEKGYSTFLAGISKEDDLMPAEAVLKAKRKYPEITLITVVPFPGHESNYSIDYKRIYHDVYHAASDRIVISDAYHDGVFTALNNFLIDSSSHLVCYCANRCKKSLALDCSNQKRVPVTNVRELISDYLCDNSYVKRALQQYHWVKHITFAWNRIILNSDSEEQIELLYAKIRHVCTANAKLHITLSNNVVYSISTISPDWKVSFQRMAPSCLTILGWCLSGWVDTLFRGGKNK